MTPGDRKHCWCAYLSLLLVPCSLWSFPLNLPLPLLGIFNAQVMTSDDMELPWSSELSHKVCSPAACCLVHSHSQVIPVTALVPVHSIGCGLSVPSRLPFLSCYVQHALQMRCTGWMLVLAYVLAGCQLALQKALQQHACKQESSCACMCISKALPTHAPLQPLRPLH